MTLTHAQKAAYAHAAQQQRQTSLGEMIAMHFAHRVAMRVVNGMEYVFWGGCDTIASGYRWLFPTTAEHVRRMAIFTRKELDGFIVTASKEGRSHIVVQAHRITEPMRQTYVRDGYTVTQETINDMAAFKIAWGETPTIRPAAPRCDVTPKKPA